MIDGELCQELRSEEEQEMVQDKPPDAAKHPKRVTHPEQPFIYVGDKDLKKIQRAAWDAGWWPERKKSGIMWRAPNDAGHVMLHGTSRGGRAFENALAQFRRAGLDI